MDPDPHIEKKGGEQEEDTRSWWERMRRFLLHDLWVVDLSSLSLKQGFLVRLLRVGQLVIRGFREDDLPLRASALTFITLMSLVPLLAFTFSLLKGLGAGEQAFVALEEQIATMPQGLEKLHEFALSLLDILRDTSFFALGGAAVLLLLWSVVQAMGSIEDSFNRVWGVTTARPLVRKILDYTGTLVVVAVLAAAAMAGGATMSIESVVARMESMPVVQQTEILKYVPMVKLITFGAVWLGFCLLYTFMPNTRVRFRPAALSALVATMLWVVWQQVYLSTQMGVARYNVLFGTFAAIPIFLAWLYVSWMIVLLGAEIAFAIQNYSTFQMERVAPRASVHAKLLLALSVLARAAESLESGKTPLNASAFAKEKGVSIRLVNDVVAILRNARLLVEVDGGEGAFVLMRSPGVIYVKDVLDEFMSDGSQPAELGLGNLRDEIKEVLVAIGRGVDEAVDKVTIRDLLPAAP